jgi:hypothetical protein
MKYASQIDNTAVIEGVALATEVLDVDGDRYSSTRTPALTCTGHGLNSILRFFPWAGAADVWRSFFETSCSVVVVLIT